MVDEDGWMLEFRAEMIPDDRPRSSLGSPGGFRPKNPKISMKNPFFRPVHCGILWQGGPNV